MAKQNVTQFPLNREDIMRLKPEDICGRVWKASKYGSADISNNNDKRLKVVRNVKRTRPAKINETKEPTIIERKNLVAPEIIEKIDDYIEDTAEKLWYILKGLFKK